MSEDLEWISRSPDPAVEGDVLGRPIIDIPEARGLLVGPDEILVVVLPGFVTHLQLDMHRARLREALGNRFALIAGDGVMLAKVKTEDWGSPAIERNS